MKAADVMVCAVISVRPNARVEEVASILLANRISAVPVVDEQDELVGIVSEGDLMRRAEAGTERSRAWWLEYLTGKQVLAAEYVKSHSHKVSDVMTRAVITAMPETPLGEIAMLLERTASSECRSCRMEKSWESSAVQTCFRHSRGCQQRTQPQAAPAIRKSVTRCSPD
jgi:CBS domain-containing protein